MRPIVQPVHRETKRRARQGPAAFRRELRQYDGRLRCRESLDQTRRAPGRVTRTPLLALRSGRTACAAGGARHVGLSVWPR